MRRILIIKPSSLGDIMQAFPAVWALRQRYPYSRISWAVKREWEDLVHLAEGVDDVIPLDRGLFGWVRQVPGIRAQEYDAVIDLQGLLRSGLLARVSEAPIRVGFANGREGSPFCYTHKVRVPSPDMHAVLRYLLAVEVVGAKVDGAPEFRFRAMDREFLDVMTLLKSHGIGIGTRWVAMQVSARWPTKQWPPERFADTANRLSREGLGPVVLIGGPTDRPVVEQVKAGLQTPVVDLTGLVPLRCLPVLLKEAALLVTNDSGPMHIAAAMGTPVVALFGPTSPDRTGPFGEGHVVLTHDVACRPCFRRECHHTIDRECLTAISTTRVCEAARQRLALLQVSR